VSECVREKEREKEGSGGRETLNARTFTRTRVCVYVTKRERVSECVCERESE